MIERACVAMKKVLIGFMSVILTISMTGCGLEGGSSAKGLVEGSEEFNEGSDLAPITDMAQLKEDSVTAFNGLGLSLIKEMANDNPEKNLLLSPVSLAFALGMLQNGAAGETKDGILTVMGEDSQGMNDRYRTLMVYLNGLEGEEGARLPGIVMKVANSLWIREPLEPKQDFVDTLSQSYDAQVYRAAFNKAETIAYMNAWVEEKTNHMLKETIKDLDPLTVAILMNTLYFKGTWENAFVKEATTEQPFYKEDGNVVPVDMMNKTSMMPYFEDASCQVTNLPYYGDNSMTVILPKEGVEAWLEGASIDILKKNITDARVNQATLIFNMPKLDVEVKNPLKNPLSERGMTLSFEPFEADFTDLIEVSGENVYISNIYQNARIIVDEEGTEAAAVTTVEFATTSAFEPEAPILFNCNRPYIYLISDDVTGAVLFIGVLNQP